MEEFGNNIVKCYYNYLVVLITRYSHSSILMYSFSFIDFQEQELFYSIASQMIYSNVKHKRFLMPSA